MWTRVVIWYHIFMMYHHSQNGYLTQNHNHPPHSHCSSQDRLQCTSEPRKKDIWRNHNLFVCSYPYCSILLICICFYSYFPLVWQTFCFRFPIGLCPVWRKKIIEKKAVDPFVEIILKNYAFQIWWNQRINRKWDQKDNPSNMQQHVTRARAPKHVRRVEMYWKKKYERVMNNCLSRGLRKNKEHHDNPSSILSEIKLPPLFF